MKLKNIQLKNVKCFRNLTINLTKPDTQEPLTVCALVGPNGSGKSTVLESLVHMFTKASMDFGGNTFKANAIKYNHNSLQINAVFELSPQEQKNLDYREDFRLFHTMENGENEESSYFIYPVISDKLSDTEKENFYQKYLTLFQTLINANDMGLILYFDAFRYLMAKNPNGPDLEEFQPDSKTGALKSNISNEGKISNKYFNVKQWLVNLDYMMLKEEKPYYKNIFNHVIKSFELLFHPLLFHEINAEGKILFKDTYTHELLDIDMLSDGFKSIFVIITAIILRLSLASENDKEDKKEPFYEKEAIILIDEIDCHIHPKWQKNIMPAFRALFPNCQFILTTHSPFILQSLNDYEIIKLGEKEIV